MWPENSTSQQPRLYFKSQYQIQPQSEANPSLFSMAASIASSGSRFHSPGAGAGGGSSLEDFREHFGLCCRIGMCFGGSRGFRA